LLRLHSRSRLELLRGAVVISLSGLAILAGRDGRTMALAWVVTVPVAALLGATAFTVMERLLP
jgi:phosphate/sulfate permease